MKLELKHLAAYLPYKLMVKIDSDYCKIQSTDWRIESNQEDGLPFSFLSDGGWLYRTLSRVKPILRPLSDLTKEITHNGETFVPIGVLYDMCQVDAEHDFLDAVTDDWASAENKIEFAPYTILQQLLAWHFDIFGLIDAGLAIDINTIIEK